MRVLLVACSSTETEANYKRLSNAVRESGTKWWHYLESIWLIKTDKTCNEVGRTLSKIAEGHLLVIEVTGFAQGSLPDKAWNWINEHVE